MPVLCLSLVLRLAVLTLLLRVTMVRLARWRRRGSWCRRGLVHRAVPLREALRSIVKIGQSRVTVDRGHPTLGQSGSAPARRAWLRGGDGRCGSGWWRLFPLRQAL